MHFSAPINYAPINDISHPLMHLASPFTGKVFNIEQHPNDLFSSGIMGRGVAVELSNGKITSPITGHVEQVKQHGSEIIINAQNGLKILINIQLPKNSSDSVLQVTSAFGKGHVEQGELLAYFDFPSLSAPLIACLIIVNADKLGPCYYPLKQVRAGQDPLITITQNNKI